MTRHRFHIFDMWQQSCQRAKAGPGVRTPKTRKRELKTAVRQFSEPVYPKTASRKTNYSLLFWVLALTLLNFSLLVGNEAYIPLLLETQPQWWQWFTHPLVHLSPYHLLIDGLAFLTLWTMLPRGLTRWIVYLTVSLGSGVAATLDPNFTSVYGFGGLSGVGHGLMAYLLLTWLLCGNSKAEKFLSLFTLLILMAKSLIEAYTGQVVLSSWHLGYLGTPLVFCHLGGALSGTIAPIVTNLPIFQKNRSHKTRRSSHFLLNKWVA